MENKYKNCQTQEEKDLVDKGYKICEDWCGSTFEYGHPDFLEFCSTKCAIAYETGA